MTNALAMTPEDVQLMLAAEVHLGARNVDANMQQYVHNRAANGIHHRHVLQTISMSFVLIRMNQPLFTLSPTYM